jgi:hypothetical protein
LRTIIAALYLASALYGLTPDADASAIFVGGWLAIMLVKRRDE